MVTILLQLAFLLVVIRTASLVSRQSLVASGLVALTELVVIVSLAMWCAFFVLSVQALVVWQGFPNSASIAGAVGLISGALSGLLFLLLSSLEAEEMPFGVKFAK